ncbi:TetR family transcriptional regulator [Kitasatospora griseola]|uniref:TetR family transcriptional regulator n=1 Tax=Kitasatospora griseola TaxID=2064 RepID=UPI00166F97BE|nr:TetR/AcrR family transcriptional regulator [Kitasatospora griseola]GGQ67197.1 TetR family transcriptional regulator [Kitasatospora griseola]
MQPQGDAAGATAETGLRDRKKARTRQAIRAAGLDLYEEQGFEQTTVDQICRRADVAHRTFFRYYASKEALLFGTDFGEAILDEFAAAPAGLDLWDAFLHAVARTDGTLEEPTEHTARRRALRRRFMGIRTVHDHAVQLIDRLVQRTIEIAAARLGTDPARDLRPHALGAVLGAMTRRHVVDGVEEEGPMEPWWDAFRQVMPPPGR